MVCQIRGQNYCAHSVFEIISLIATVLIDLAIASSVRRRQVFVYAHGVTERNHLGALLLLLTE